MTKLNKTATGRACTKCNAILQSHGTSCPNCGSPRGLGFFALFALCMAVLLVFGVIVEAFKSKPQAATISRSSAPSEASQKTLALLVVMSGDPCAKVMGVRQIDKDLVEVDCLKYIDSATRSTHEINLLTMAVR